MDYGIIQDNHQKEYETYAAYTTKNTNNNDQY